MALFAGLLDDQTAQVIADTSLMSFFDLLQQRTPNRYDRRLQEPMFLPGAMKKFDVADLAAVLAPVPLMLLARIVGKPGGTVRPDRNSIGCKNGTNNLEPQNL